MVLLLNPGETVADFFEVISCRARDAPIIDWPYIWLRLKTRYPVGNPAWKSFIRWNFRSGRIQNFQPNIYVHRACLHICHDIPPFYIRSFPGYLAGHRLFGLPDSWMCPWISFYYFRTTGIFCSCSVPFISTHRKEEPSLNCCWHAFYLIKKKCHFFW